MSNEQTDIEAFTRQIEKLEISVSQNAEGHFTVSTSAEPLFCYDALTEEEIEKLVADTFTSYAKHFFRLDDIKIGTKSTPVVGTTIPIERSKPVSRLTPVFDLAA